MKSNKMKIKTTKGELIGTINLVPDQAEEDNISGSATFSCGCDSQETFEEVFLSDEMFAVSNLLQKNEYLFVKQGKSIKFYNDNSLVFDFEDHGNNQYMAIVGDGTVLYGSMESTNDKQG